MLNRPALPLVCAVTLLAAAGCEPTTGVDPAACRPTGYSTVSLAVASQQRQYVVYKPATLNSAQPAPVLVFFHGLGSNAEQQKAFTALNRTSEARGFLLVLAESGDGNWLLSGASNPEFPYVDALLSDLSRCFNVDASRIYAAGHSNGAMLTYRLLEHRAATFAGFAAFAGSAFNNILLQSVNAPTPRPFIWVHGSEDELFAWEHPFVSFSTRAGARDMLAAQWTCSATARVGPADELSGCRNGARIRSLVVTGMKHVMWPSPHSTLPPPGLTFDANEMVWDFLAAYRR